MNYLKKTGGFGALLRGKAHVEPADPGGSATGSRGPLGLLPNNGGIEGRKDSSPHHLGKGGRATGLAVPATPQLRNH